MQDEMQEIRKACEGLEYPSESDTPFEVIHWPAAGAATAQAQVAAHNRPGRKIEELTPDDFFAELFESDDGDRYRHLRATLEAHVKDLKIFRVGSGEVRVDIYLLGQSASGDWIGLHTSSVET
jgi:hypothetical protein